MKVDPLTSEEKDGFVRNGAVIRRGFVTDDLLGPARLLVKHWIKNEMDSGRIESYTQRTFAPELGSHRDLLNLYHDSGVLSLVISLVGDPAPVSTVQIQIRLAGDLHGITQAAKPMHVDGVACPHLDVNELRTFSLLVGVVLSDISDAEMGALRYVPGGHLRMARWFSTEWSSGMTKQVPDHIDIEGGVPLLGEPGDVLLMHHLVPHSVGSNRSTEPRVMAYFRVSHRDHHTRRLESLRSPWLDFPGIGAR